MSVLIHSIVSIYDTTLVLQAVILTFTIFVGLTLFTMQTKYDFSAWAPFLFGSLWVLIGVGLVNIFVPFSRAVDGVYASLIAIVFCGFIIFDTHNILHNCSPEDYIVASVDLYLDVLNLFLAILRILKNSQSD